MSNAVDDDEERCRARVGTTLRGKWHIDGLLGIGGMAAVYSATHKIGRRAAIKILHPEIAVSKELRARFEQEALAVNQLGHPATVGIYDIDTTEEGAPFMAMELLDGESLGQRAYRLGGIAERELLETMSAVLDVLQAAHDRGIIHRDIKPDNLFVTSSGGIKVLDFGIARMKGGSNVRTRTGAMLGTTPYMPPEQISGGNIDGRSDVFAVGATMFRILTKRRIHEASTDAELLIRMATEPAPPLRSVAPFVSLDMARIVDKALSFDISRRYASARAMRDDIASVLRGDVPTHAAAAAAIGDQPTRAEASRGVDPATSAPVGSVRFGAPSSREMGAMAEAPTMFAMPAPVVPKKSAPTALIVAVGASLLLGIGATTLFFVLREPSGKAETARSRTDDDDDDERTEAPRKPTASASTPKLEPSSSPPTATQTARPAAPAVADDKYRLLEKKGGYLFCVDSGLKHAYAVKTQSDGSRVCNGAPEGQVPIEGLKPYTVAQPRWK
ncbi:MAG: protein kinase [Polyangiaceae bacterium]|nr:protein kinase [Polyangiaceae bacterium]